jgi:hypothetical protein
MQRRGAFHFLQSHFAVQASLDFVMDSTTVCSVDQASSSDGEVNGLGPIAIPFKGGQSIRQDNEKGAKNFWL